MSNSQRSMGFLDWLQLLLVWLKLTEQIDWSWWWVLWPSAASVVCVVLTMEVKR